MEENKKPEREVLNDPKLCILILQMAVTAILLIGMFGLRLSGSRLYKDARTIYYTIANDTTAVQEVLGEDGESSENAAQTSSQAQTESEPESESESESQDMKESEIIEDNTSVGDTAIEDMEAEDMASANVFDFKTVQTALNTGISKSNTLLWPLETYRISSPYGYRSDPFTGKRAFHYGLDMAANKGTPIAAVLDGTVSAVGEGASYGNYIMVRHSSNMSTLYAHCSEIVAKEGQKIEQGNTIALVGSTGRSTGNHLHFEIRIGGKRVDPMWLLP